MFANVSMATFCMYSNPICCCCRRRHKCGKSDVQHATLIHSSTVFTSVHITASLTLLSLPAPRWFCQIVQPGGYTRTPTGALRFFFFLAQLWSVLLLNATVSRQTDRWTKCNCSVNNKQPEMRGLRLPSFYFVCSAHFRLHSVELVSLSPAIIKSRVFRCMERANGWIWPCPLLYIYIYIFYFSSDLYCWLLSSGHLVHHLHCWLFSQQAFLILAEQNSFHSSHERPPQKKQKQPTQTVH